MTHLSQRLSKRVQFSAGMLMLLGVGWFTVPASVAAPEAPTKQFTRRNVPIAWILNEWYDKSGKQIPMYVCVCTRSTCDVSNSWPFREFSVGETIPALGPSNKNGTEQMGFVCGQVEPSDLPIRGIGG